MLNWINNQGVRSDEGWVLQRAHRFGYHYVEEDHLLDIVVDSGEVFLRKELAWNAPFNDESISEEKREQIKLRVIDAMRFMGTRYKLSE